MMQLPPPEVATVYPDAVYENSWEVADKAQTMHVPSDSCCAHVPGFLQPYGQTIHWPLD